MNDHTPHYTYPRQALLRVALAAALLAAVPLTALADVKQDVWRATSIKVDGKDAIQDSQPPGGSHWMGPAGGLGDTVDVTVIWEPSGFAWSHLAHMCNVPYSDNEPNALIGTVNGPSGYQGKAQTYDNSPRKFIFTYTGIPKNTDFFVYIKCDAPVFSPGTELISVFEFVDLKHKISVTPEQLENGGFDPYGFPEASAVEVDMPSDPGKFPDGGPQNYAIFVKAITTNPPTSIRGQFQKAVNYQVGGWVGDISIPSDTVYVSQWADHPGPIDAPTDWSSLAYGGPETKKGVMTEMGDGGQFPPGIYRVRVRAEDSELPAWSDWWQFRVGDVATLKSEMIAKVNPELLDLIQNGANRNVSRDAGGNAQFGNKASRIKSQLEGQPLQRQLQNDNAKRTGVFGAAVPSKKPGPEQDRRNELFERQSQAGLFSRNETDRAAGNKLLERLATKQQNTGNDALNTAKATRNTRSLQPKSLNVSVSGNPRAGQDVQLNINIPGDAHSKVSIQCLAGDCADRSWTQALASQLRLPRSKFGKPGNYKLKLKSAAYSTVVAFRLSPSLRAGATDNDALKRKPEPEIKKQGAGARTLKRQSQ